MKVKRIFAPDMRQAMRRVREELGSEAIIVSNHRVAGGVEVVAAHAQEYEAAQAEFQQEYERKKRYEEQVSQLSRPSHPDLEEALYQARMHASESYPASTGRFAEQVDDEQEQGEDLRSILESLRRSQQQEAIRPESAPTHNEFADLPAAHASDEIAQMQAEIAQLKSMLSTRIQQEVADTSPAVWVEETAPQPARERGGVTGQLQKRFERLGLSDLLTAHLIKGLEKDLDITKAWRIGLGRLAQAVPVMGEDYIQRGGMIAFVGPTGVGKTTTIGKLAARYVLQHGSADIALVTTDSYRIAAHEQLKTFGRILDIPVRVVDENNTLDGVLRSLKNKRLVLIDTAGMGQSERASRQQQAMFAEVSLRMKKLLVLSCSSHRQVLNDACDYYQSLGLNGCILSKMDESGSLGEALSVAIERKLPVAYITDGQKVPDDIAVVKRSDLVSRAVVTAQKALARERSRPTVALEF